jgi:hypothetical protein
MSRVSQDNGTGYVKPSTICILTNIFTTFIFKTGCVVSFLGQLAKYIRWLGHIERMQDTAIQKKDVPKTACNKTKRKAKNEVAG